MTIRIQVREYSKVVYALHTFSQEYQIALPEEHCSSLFRNKKFMLDEMFQQMVQNLPYFWNMKNQTCI